MAVAGGKPAGLAELLSLTPAQFWLCEDAALHSRLLQDHHWFIRDTFRDSSGSANTAGRVPLALNHAPTTFEDLGLDPNHPDVAIHWTQKVTKGMQGLNTEKALAEEYQRQQRKRAG